MDFSEALRKVKSGSKIARLDWNSSDICVELMLPDKNSKSKLPYLYIKINTDKIYPVMVPWAPTQIDILAEDWYEL